MCFTYCQVPVIYELSNENGIKVELKEGDIINIARLQLGEKMSQDIFNRTGIVKQIHVFLSDKAFK